MKDPFFMTNIRISILILRKVKKKGSGFNTSKWIRVLKDFLVFNLFICLFPKLVLFFEEDIRVRLGIDKLQGLFGIIELLHNTKQ